MKTKILRLLMLLLLLMTAGVSHIWAADGITTIPYYMDFSDSTEPFDGGAVVSGTNVFGVLRVTNSTATASFANIHTLNNEETVSVAFTAYHGYLNNNSTSSVQLLNSDGIVLIGYTYNHTSGQIVDVTIGGATNSDFSAAFDAASYANGAQRANGLTGGNSGRPYLNDDNANPNITMSVKGDGTAILTIWIGSKSSWHAFSGSLSDLKVNLASLKIVSNCGNDDRTICIDKLNISSNYYSNNYESGVLDWTTSVGDRYPPVILEESGNHYLSVNQDQRYNNGATLGSRNFGVTAGSSYQMTFDLRVSSSNDQSPTIFRVLDAANANDIFSLTATDKQVTTWKLNDGDEVTLPGTYQNTEHITNVPWYNVTILRSGTNTWITIKDKSSGVAVVENKYVAASNIGGIGKMEFLTSRNNANFAIDNIYVQPILDWSVANATVNIRDVGTSDPNTMAGLPYIHQNSSAVTGYASSDGNVAYVSGTGTSAKIIIKGVGTTTLTATDANGYSATTTLTVTGDQHNPTTNAENNTLTFADRGYIVNNTAGTGYSHTLSTGLKIDFGYNGETALIVQNGSFNVLKIIDANGYSHPNLSGTGVVIPWEGQYGGTFVKLTPSNNGYLTIVGNVSAENTKLYRNGNVLVETDINEENHTLAATLTGGSVYYLYNRQTAEEEANGTHTSLVHSISFSNPLFVSSTAVIEIPSDGNYTIPAVGSMTPSSYELTKYGDLTGSSLGVSGGILRGIDNSGAVLIKLSDGTSTAYHLVTVAYKATEYPGKIWDFNIAGKSMTTSDNLKNAPTPTTTITDDNHNSWTARYKNVHVNRAPEWRLNRPVDGDNVVILPETAGLLFNTHDEGFYLRNDNATFKHVGIYNYNASFTIPFLKTGDIVELNWKHDAANSGSNFYATNLTDLRYKPVCPNADDTFEITESAFRTNDNNPGRYSFIVASDGDVTFTLKDWGYTDILSIRIYKGPYRSTMRSINAEGNVPAATTMILDNAEQDYSYNYCNQLYSTATGPAFYVLKGYRRGIDPVECVTGADSAHSPTAFSDNDADYPAYPVTAEESNRLYDLRKNIGGFHMYNQVWQSSRNSYSFGHIAATNGWGKVTIRMNNYTNDMKYVIGYTPDYTLTIGSAPHQEYPYTWDFTKIAGGTATGKSDNVLYSIEAEGSNSNFSEQAPTNWLKNENGQYTLNTDNNGELGSQYVPGAVLVTQDRALSKFNGAPYTDKYAKDELTGLGFDGNITMHIDHLPSNVSSGWNRATGADVRNSLLSFKITDYAVFTQTVGTEEEPIGEWSNPATVKTAGNGTVQIHENVSITESSIPSGGIGCQLNDGDTKYIHVMPSSQLQAGDIISVTAYNAYNYRDAGISFNKSDSKTDVAQSMMLSGRMVEETLNYTVVANDGLDGRNDFYLYKEKNNGTVHITAVEITRSASAVPNLDWSIYTLSNTTITVPDLNADGKQDWIYVSATEKPASVTNATEVTEGTDGPDANANVYKYKVTSPGHSYITFSAGTKIYKIGVTHLLKEIHPVGGTGWATEIRKQAIDHELIGYFTKNDVNAYTVAYDSYDLNTATVALTPVNEDGYVPVKTGIVMKLDNVEGLSDANAGKNVPLFYPSYTRPATSTPVDFPTNNLMYNVDEGIENDNRNYNEEIFNYNGTKVNYTKFILTNKYWTFDKDHALSTDEAATQHTADAAGFYRMHIWKTGDIETKNTMPAHTAYLLVPSDNLPAAVWTLQSGYSAARETTIGVYNIIGPNSATGIKDIELTPGLATDEENTAEDGVWYTLSGVKLPKRPTKEGLYIWRSTEGGNNGKTVFVNPRGR